MTFHDHFYELWGEGGGVVPSSNFDHFVVIIPTTILDFSFYQNKNSFKIEYRQSLGYEDTDLPIDIISRKSSFLFVNQIESLFSSRSKSKLTHDFVQ